MTPQEWADRLVETAWKPVLATPRRVQRRLHPHHRRSAHDARAGLPGSACTTRARSTRATYEGPYCVGCEEFKLPGELIDGDRRVRGPAGLRDPRHAGRDAQGDQLVLPAVGVCATRLLAHYEAHPEARRSRRARATRCSRSSGRACRTCRSRGRAFDWGIPVPWDEKQVVYVWFDALLNYATAVGFGDAADREGGRRFARTWPADVHLVGKDILRFHAVIWPAMLMAAGLPAARQGVRARLAAGRRREDEQVQADRHRAAARSSTTSASTRSATTSCGRSSSVRTARSPGRT